MSDSIGCDLLPPLHLTLHKVPMNSSLPEIFPDESDLDLVFALTLSFSPLRTLWVFGFW